MDDVPIGAETLRLWDVLKTCMLHVRLDLDLLNMEVTHFDWA